MILFQDGDNAGKDRSIKIKKDYDIPYLLTDEKESSIEDLFPQEIYLKSVKLAYSAITLDFNESEQKITMITKRLEKLFERKGLEMDKYLITQKLVKIIPDNPESVQPFEEIFSKINNIASKISIATS